MVFGEPIWLILALPALLALSLWPPPTASLRWLRRVVLMLIVLALARPALRLPSRAGTVMVVADRSESMPAEGLEAQSVLIGRLQKERRRGDRLGVVAFGARAVVESPPQTGAFGGFATQVGGGLSDLASALETAISALPADGGARLLVLSDGQWTGRTPADIAAKAVARDVAVDYRLQQRSPFGDTAIRSVHVPEQVTPGQSFLLTAWVDVPRDTVLSYRLRRGSQLLARGTKQVSAGVSRLLFRDQAQSAGALGYELDVAGGDADPVPENNRARLLVGVAGPRPILCVSPKPGSGLAGLLRDGGLDIRARTPGACRWGLADLANYAGVVVENIPADAIGVGGLDILAQWVRHSGGGLMVSGGRNSFGPGGYFGSPLEPVLPISMELRREHRKLSLAIMVALDRSGSMSAPAGPGRTKMDLANMGAVQVLDLLSDYDEFGVLAVDSSSHTILPLTPVAGARGQRGTILKIGSQGGGIFVYEALVSAVEMLAKSGADTRHVVLFADAADAEQPGRYKDLLAKSRQANITVSVVGLGRETDSDAEFLRDVAARGDGRCFFSDDPADLPRLFAQDTFAVARSTFVEQSTPIALTAGMTALTGQQLPQPPTVGGYNLCYLRPEATSAATTQDDNQAPVVASWQAGSGRVLCYTGEADGKYAGQLAAWQHAGDLFAGLARWTAGAQDALPAGMVATQRVRDGVLDIRLHLDPEYQQSSPSGTPAIRLLRSAPGSPPKAELLSMLWVGADELACRIPMNGRETLLPTLQIGPNAEKTFAPACLPYSPEFAPPDPAKGKSALSQVATMTGGVERVDVNSIWASLPRKHRMVSASPSIMVLALVVFLLEILERRTGLLAGLRRRKRVMQPTAQAAPAVARPRRRGRRRGAARTEKNAGSQPETTGAEETQPESQPDESSTFEAMRQVRSRRRR